MDFVLPMIVSGSGVLVAAIAYFNRDRPDVQRDMPRLMFIALLQVALGVIAWVEFRP